MSMRYAGNMLDAIMKNYYSFYSEKYIDQLILPNNASNISSNDCDYIESAEILTLDSSVRDYEPIWALDGGEDGLRFYRGILKYWRSLLKPGGYLLFEVGEGQAEAVKELVLSAGFASASTRKDTLGVERVVVGKMYDEDGELYSGF